MVGRNRTLLVLACLASVALAGCGARGEAATVEAPEWHSGYTWAHNGTLRYSYVESFGDERENGTGSAEFSRTERVVQTEVDADGEPAYLTVQRFAVDGDDVGLPTTPFLAGYRQSDLKPLEVMGARSESCSSRGPCSVALHDVKLEDENPDDPFLRFPLRTGDSWSGTYSLYGDELEMRYTVEVGRMRAIETPLGKVDALRLDIKHRPSNLDELVQEFEQEAREDGFAVEDLRIDIRFDEVYYYSPAYQNVVQVVTTGQELFSARVPDGEGGKMQVRSESRHEQRVALAGARLVAGSELTLEEVAGLLRPDADLGDVSGVPVPEAAYTVAVSVVDGEVNAFEAESGRFEATLGGVEALPEGHTLRWSLQRGGTSVATATGEVFEPQPERPGRYAVVLEALDGSGGVVASAGSGLVAQYEGRIEVPCALVIVDPGAFGVGACEEQSLPVHPGVRSVHVVATPQGPPNPTAELRVDDAIGRPVPVRQEGDQYVVELTSFDGLNVDAEPWTAEWAAVLGVMEGAVLDVSIDYGAAPAATQMEVSMGIPPTAGLPWWLPAPS